MNPESLALKVGLWPWHWSDFTSVNFHLPLVYNLASLYLEDFKDYNLSPHFLSLLTLIYYTYSWLSLPKPPLLFSLFKEKSWKSPYSEIFSVSVYLCKLISPVPWYIPRAETDGKTCDSQAGPGTCSLRQHVYPVRPVLLRFLCSVRKP